jgi:hypothetical protein
VVVGIETKGVDKGSQVVVVGEDDGEVPLAEVLVEASRRGLPKMFVKLFAAKVLTEACRCGSLKMFAKALLQRCLTAAMLV